MKKFLLFIITLFVCVICRADTFTQYWYVEDNTPIQTSCTTGGDIILPTPPTKYGYDFIGWEKLPYIPVEYLESTGTQYIDTKIKPNQDTRVLIKFNITRISSLDFIYGAREASRVNDYGINTNGTTFRIHYNNTLIDTNIPFVTGTDFVVDQNKNTVTINDVVFNLSYNNFITPVNLFLFATDANGTVSDKSNIKIYFVQIYDNDVLVRDFIPVLDIDGIPCMFDKVESKFYYNAGTGQFIAGPVIGE